MRVVWCTLWFLDYRIPVFYELSKIKNIDFYLVYSADANSDAINEKIKSALGDRAIPLAGEVHFGKSTFEGFANQGFRIPYQPGLVKTVKKLKPDVMISDGFFQWSYATLLLRATKRIPHVMCYERTMHTERNAQKIRTLYRKFALKWIDVICCAGSLCQEYVRYLGFKNKPLTSGFMVADVDAFKKNLENQGLQINKEQISSSKTINYLFVGRLIELKGIVQLLNVWRDFSKHNPNVKLTIIGKGELEDFIIEEIQKHNINSIDFLGGVDYDKISKYYIEADVFVLPTLEDNWSLVVSEAMACSLPIITSKYNGCYPELVKEDNGWVMDPLDSDEFLNVLNESYNSRDKFKEMGESSFELLKDYTPQIAAKRLYESCVLALKSKK